ncbi:leucyl aminopeptidase [Immundisolibacter sp.]|uniref:leucyl aminopeptidase n=1 Tax=Immundisolibacter sp. TaxID=1934948 RepID=UPI00261779CE|nr:leucyl aminopeptidase [Immundisolibacter sp.]MDD3649871.1 leucyl aminopeptidase [Immundisolibacter sp.]
MQFELTRLPVTEQPGGCVAVGVFASHALAPSAKLLDKASDGAITAAVKAGDIAGKVGDTLLLRGLPGIAAERVLLVGCGKAGELNEGAYQRIVAAAAAAVGKLHAAEAALYLTELAVTGHDEAWRVRTAVAAADHALYRFTEYKREPGRRHLKTLAIGCGGKQAKALDAALRQGQAIAAGVKLTRDLGNQPANVCTPTYLAEQAQALAKAHGLDIEVLDEPQMRELGMGALLAVARGSRQPPKLIVLKHLRGKAKAAPVVLVGKGVTFDSGGISIKPGAGMDEMKFDMCGAASVLGTLKVAAELDLPINLIGVIPASENLPDGNAIKPGDIVKTMAGKTVEILNTDAEGRLLLCDALTYAERFKPDAIVDIATLTGACVVSLGNHAHGLLGNDQKLIDALLAAGRTAHDRAWQLPLWDDYKEQLKSPFADLPNVAGREAGTITAAAFLSAFTEKQRWAHLDIAGTAWKSGKDKSATGRPVGLLVQYLLDRVGG